MGEAFGEACRESIHGLATLRLEAAQSFVQQHTGQHLLEPQLLSEAHAALAVSASWDPTTHAEFLGIARGANLTPERLFILQGLTDLRDRMAFYDEAQAEGCSSLILKGERTQGGHLLAGQNWDLETSNMDYVVLVRRKPADAPETVSLTLTGCLSLIGLNNEGVGVGTTNLIFRENQTGIHYLQLIHRLLRSRTVAEAAAVVEQAPRMAAHYYYLVDAGGQGIGLECSARKVHRFQPEGGRLVRCNHALHPEFQLLEPLATPESTCFRQQRLEALIDTHDGPISVEDLKAFFADHEGGELSLCRHRNMPGNVSTNAAVILSPQTGELHACRGQAHAGEWRRIALH